MELCAECVRPGVDPRDRVCVWGTGVRKSLKSSKSIAFEVVDGMIGIIEGVNEAACDGFTGEVIKSANSSSSSMVG